MNEILSNIYIAYKYSPTHESDVFFSFTIIMRSINSKLN